MAGPRAAARFNSGRNVIGTDVRAFAAQALEKGSRGRDGA
jgi:hypothetical protein